jgi:hypothetical protein
MTNEIQEQTIEGTAREIERVQLGTIQASSPQDIVVRATAMAKTLSNIITEQGLFTTISGRKYVHVEGWTTLGAMLGIMPREVEGGITEHENGDYEAVVELIRASDGAVIGRASSIVSTDEKTWANRPRYARRSMAVTRATGKAYRLGFSWIMKLAGYEPTPAEEMPMEGSYRELAKPKRNPAPKREQVEDAITDAGPVLPENGDSKEVDLKSFNRPYTAEQLKMVLEHNASLKNKSASDKQRNLLGSLLSEHFQDDTKRYECSEWLFGARSTKDIDGAMVIVALDWLKPTKDDGGAYAIDNLAKTELGMAHTASLEASGQEALL